MKQLEIARSSRRGILVVSCVATALALAGCGGGRWGWDGWGNGGLPPGGGGTQNGFTLSADVTGLNSSGLSLYYGGAPSVQVPSGATTVVVASALTAGATYNVTVGTQPAGENCTTTNGSGTVSGNVSVTITCSSASSGLVLYSFAGGNDGAAPFGALMQASDGNFYGTTFEGGAQGDGTVFKITPTGIETVLYSFAGGSDGANPLASLVQASDGNLYGTTETGANTEGTVFKVTPAGVETVLYTFPGHYGDNLSGLIQATDGNFYGTTVHDGMSNCGTVFKVTPAGVETTLYSFAGGGDGCNPPSGVIQASDGNFYGTTSLGGTDDRGTVFKVTPAGLETVLYSFVGGSSDGSGPEARLIQASDGNFYGTTWNGGVNAVGTVFKVTPAGAETVLYSFTGVADGGNPAAALIQGDNGNFYGIAPACCSPPFGNSSSSGQSAMYGTGGLVFTITSTGAFGILYSFDINGSDGSLSGGQQPSANLIQASNGNLYGTAASGGANNEGTVFQVDPLQ